MTVRYHFHAGQKGAVPKRMPDRHRNPARFPEGRNEEPTVAFIDSRPVKTTESGGPSEYGAWKKFRGRKRHGMR